MHVLVSTTALLAQPAAAQPGLCGMLFVFLFLLHEFAVVLHKHCGLFAIYDEKSFILKFSFVCIVGYASEPNCRSVGAGLFFSL